MTTLFPVEDPGKLTIDRATGQAKGGTFIGKVESLFWTAPFRVWTAFLKSLLATLTKCGDSMLAVKKIAQKRKFDDAGVGSDHSEDVVEGEGSLPSDMLSLLAKAADEMDIEGGELDADETSGSTSGSVSPTPIQPKLTYTYVGASKTAGSADTGLSRKEKTLYRCDVCGWSTVQLARYLKHKTGSHSKRTEWTIRFSCHKCAFSTPLKSMLEDHERTKHAHTGAFSISTFMDVEKPSTPAPTLSGMLPTLYSGQKPLVIALPPAGSPPTASRGASVGIEKLFEAFLEAILREEGIVMERVARLQTTLAGLTSKINSIKEELGRICAEIIRIEAEITNLGYIKSKLVALIVTVEDDDVQVELDAIEVRLMTLKETLVSLISTRDTAIQHGKDTEAQVASFSTTIEQLKATFQTVQFVKSDFIGKKNEVDSVKQKVDELYKDILVTFARKNELELKRIMDPALDDKDALELLSTRHKCENELQFKVSAFIELRTKWNNGRSNLAQYVQANKSKVVGIAA